MLGKRLAAAREQAGLKQVELAVALGDRYDQAMISRVESDQKRLRFDGATKAARELGVSLDYLAGLTNNPEPAAKLDKALAQERAKVSELDDASAVTTDEADGHSVDVMELDTAAGAGAVVDFERVKDRIRFRQSWLRKHGLVARQCKVIGVKGTSMEPTLADGCSILIDLNRRSRIVRHIYVVRTDDGLIVKRAGKSQGGQLAAGERQPGQAGMADAALASRRRGHRRGEVGGPDVLRVAEERNRGVLMPNNTCCHICERDDAETTQQQSDGVHVCCPRCGSYVLTRRAETILLPKLAQAPDVQLARARASHAISTARLRTIRSRSTRNNCDEFVSTLLPDLPTQRKNLCRLSQGASRRCAFGPDPHCRP